MTNYTPFDKELENLDEQELQKLIERQISESRYIEYKSELPKKAGKIDSLKITKSISAFANTKGVGSFLGLERIQRILPPI
jgi:predicted HTH transcriptional regulator